MDRFGHVSKQYREKSLVQQKAAEKLIRLAEIGAQADILDAACGPGNITHALRKLTSGRVVGTDISAGMIEQAQHEHPEIEFKRVSAEYLEFNEEFDLVYCNSALQWFREPERAVRAMHAALRKPGKIALASPATQEAMPCFERVIGLIREDERIRDTFSHWRTPWFFLNDADDYRSLMEHSGFHTTWFEIAFEANEFTPEQAYQVFQSGARVGYADPGCYDIPIGQDYLETFDQLVQEAFASLAQNGKVTVDFNRLYYIGVRQ